MLIVATMFCNAQGHCRHFAHTKNNNLLFHFWTSSVCVQNLSYYGIKRANKYLQRFWGNLDSLSLPTATTMYHLMTIGVSSKLLLKVVCSLSAFSSNASVFQAVCNPTIGQEIPIETSWAVTWQTPSQYSQPARIRGGPTAVRVTRNSVL